MSSIRPLLASSLIVVALAGCEKPHTPTPKVEDRATRQNAPETRVPSGSVQPGAQGTPAAPR